jgi:DNA-binding LacI/PurR family transcriptional regulator
MGAAAAALLIDSIQGSDTVGEGCAFRTSLVVRGST